MMDAKKVLNQTEQLEQIICKKRTSDVKTKYKVISYFKEIRRLVNYQIPMRPIDISEDGRRFVCPRCDQLYEADEGWTVDDFIFCPQCGQRFKGEE